MNENRAPVSSTLTTEPAPRESVGAAAASKLASRLVGVSQTSPLEAIRVRAPARNTAGARGGSATLFTIVAVAGSRISRELLTVSRTRTVAPAWSTLRLELSLVTTVLSSITAVFARPMAWRVSFVTQTAASPRSSRWAV
ncbi:hypothetical protein [Cryobacterium breve]|uniref:hypothetical protein n=1 Tax=Cryobacterium breve TaxID=1259258 RepID=UPI00248AAE28|nr:hypothetical protein [Cryobacterium breve]